MFQRSQRLPSSARTKTSDVGLVCRSLPVSVFVKFTVPVQYEVTKLSGS